MSSRESILKSNSFGESIKDLFPICDHNDSDTASFDNVFELLNLGGRNLEHTMAMMMPA